MNIIAMGYSGTGSSAIIHLLSEYENTTTANLGKYEHLPLYTPHGLFDLEDRLLLNNSLYQSDAAINDFYLSMKWLNENDFGWFAGYKKKYGDQFMNIVDEFVSELIDYELSGYWSYDFKYKRSGIALGKDIIKKIIGKEVRKFGYQLDNTGDGKVVYSFVDENKFYHAAKQFLMKYFNMINPEKNKILLVDQIILPHNLYRINNYFDDSTKFIVMSRDPRDMYILSKYVWTRMGSPAIFPTSPSQFVNFYSSLKKIERKTEDPKILRLNFEDLVYQYDKTIMKIEDFLDSKLGRHRMLKQHFQPDMSIKNTQNFRINSEWENEVSYIAETMKEQLYEFPYVITPDIEETTDP